MLLCGCPDRRCGPKDGIDRSGLKGHHHGMPKPDRDEVRGDFRNAVNMTAIELDNWLRTRSSHAVGWKGADGNARESVGHASGRHIVRLRTRNEDLTERDYAHMRKVVGFVQRHGAQRPANIDTSRWRYSLMNWATTRGKISAPQFALSSG